MYRYVFKRVKDTIEFGVNVRKSFACQHPLNTKSVQINQTTQQQQQQKKKNEEQPEKESIIRFQEINFLVAQQKRIDYEDFKKKYNCHHPNNCSRFVQALTWSTALIAGFYTSQLLCLYRRKHHLSKKCLYSQYFYQKNKFLHRKIFCVQQARAENKSLAHTNLTRFACPFKRGNKSEQKEEATQQQQQNEKREDDVKDFVDKFTRLNLFNKRFEKFIPADDVTIGRNNKVFYNVNNDGSSVPKTRESNNEKSAETKSSTLSDPNINSKKKTQQEIEDETIDSIMSNLSDMIGELEFEMGVQFVLQGDYNAAVEHFRMSSATNNASACFNLALLYEQGLGVKKDLKVAMQLYKMASDIGDHDKAQYNLGVYFAKGLGGVKKSAKKARLYFEKAAMHGNIDALRALSLAHSVRQKSALLVDPDEIKVGSVVKSVEYGNSMQPIAVT